MLWVNCYSMWFASHTCCLHHHVLWIKITLLWPVEVKYAANVINGKKTWEVELFWSRLVFSCGSERDRAVPPATHSSSDCFGFPCLCAVCVCVWGKTSYYVGPSELSVDNPTPFSRRRPSSVWRPRISVGYGLLNKHSYRCGQ